MLLNLIFCLFLFGVYFIVLRIEFSLRKKIKFFLKFKWVSALGLLMVFVAPFLFIFSVKNSVIAANFFQNMYELFFQNLFLGFERILSKYQQSSGDIERVELLRAAIGYTIFYSLFVFREMLFSAIFFYKDLTMEIKDPVTGSHGKKFLLTLLLFFVAYTLFTGDYSSSCGRASICFGGNISYGSLVLEYSFDIFLIFCTFSLYLAQYMCNRT
ncbi:hypothetical protein [Kingella denitrificans]|uniref:hypothetical protein n=1 Tax=Kingella denitrificans TaxID=502 RepID=UPI0028D46EB1|nr:hypothetical protein [Kingella denitrificans]